MNEKLGFGRINILATLTYLIGSYVIFSSCYVNSVISLVRPPAGETPLLHAARRGHTLTAKYLLDCGADPAIPSQLGGTALHHSAGIGVWVGYYSLKKMSGK